MNFSNVKLDTRMIDTLLRDISDSIDAETISTQASVNKSRLESSLSIAIEEARHTLELLVDLPLWTGMKALEVGAGYGIASIALASVGLDVYALEPGGLGFEENRKVSREICLRHGVRVTHIDESAGSVDFEQLGKFDLIFSNNVLEHIQDIRGTMSNLITGLSEDGYMVHSCPNYTFPFEPHFGIPLVPFKSRWTTHVVPRRIRNDGVWMSLNFLTARQVRKITKRYGYMTLFKRGTMATSLVRLRWDEHFRRRHPVLGRISATWLGRAVVSLMSSAPTFLVTPMDFLVSKGDSPWIEQLVAWRRSKSLEIGSES